jgi:hypothetical protein
MTAAQWQAIPTLGEESRVPPCRSAPRTVRASPSRPISKKPPSWFAHGDLNGAGARLLELLVQGLDHAPVDRRAVVASGRWC